MQDVTPSDDATSFCRIDGVAGMRTLEFSAFAWPTPAISAPAWPSTPGAVRYGAQQRPLLLHFAPGRWLAPDPDPEIGALLEGAAQAAAGAVVEVTGKWRALQISGPGAGHLLACTIAVEAVLTDRDCAALTLFDCPAILARAPDGFAVWVQASYATDFTLTAQRFRSSFERPP
jgi:heterotetrameric sarcosine oxidase gamma subunit